MWDYLGTGIRVCPNTPFQQIRHLKQATPLSEPLHFSDSDPAPSFPSMVIATLLGSFPSPRQRASSPLQWWWHLASSIIATQLLPLPQESLPLVSHPNPPWSHPNDPISNLTLDLPQAKHRGSMPLIALPPFPSSLNFPLHNFCFFSKLQFFFRVNNYM